MKLVELLARELDVWPEGAVTITQDYDGDVGAYGIMDPECLVKPCVWKAAGHITNISELSDIATDHATAIVTRADWEAERARIAKPSEANWIRHRGGKCPVEAGVLVEIRMRYGAVCRDLAGDLRWGHGGSSVDVMAYRVCEPVQTAEPEPLTADEWAAVTQPDTITINLRDPHPENPLLWRDRIHAIDASVEALEEERASLVQRLADEGLQLVGVASLPDEQWPEGAPSRQDAPDWATHIGRDRQGFNWFDHDPHQFDETAHVKGCLGDEGYPDGKALVANMICNDLPLWSAAI